VVKQLHTTFEAFCDRRTGKNTNYTMTEYTYLYDGDYDHEKKYLQTYIDTPESVIVLAFDGDKVVGTSTALPMNDPF